MRNAIKKYVKYNELKSDVEDFNAREYPERDHFTPERLREVRGIRNANAHAYVSAMIERDQLPGVAGTLGTAREWESWLSGVLSGEDNTKDHLRDEWNNDIGRQIGRYAKDHGLRGADVLDLVDYARRNGDLIRSISNVRPDPRLQPYADSSEEPTWSGPPPRNLSPLEAIHEKRELQSMQANSDNWQSKRPLDGGTFWSRLFPGRGSLRELISGFDY